MREYYKIAIYMRISKEDKEKKESNSIYMQRMLLKNYVRLHFVNYKLLEFQDDGYTGTNLERPGIQSLLKLVKSLEVDCIIVKDFSRFSRDYIELGIYIEQIFPLMGIRFISVNDSFDSEEQKWNGSNIEYSFQYLLCDLYSKDLSVKIKSSLEMRNTQGMYVSANCPFGYRKSSNNRHVVLIAEDEAAIVRKIFSMKMEGMTSSQIAKTFNQQKVKTPIEFKIEKGLTSRKPKGEKFQWTNSTVCQILNNEFYIGDLIYGKYKKDSVGGRNHLKAREEWRIITNHHEAIIDRKQFALIQRKEKGKRINKSGERTHFFVGRLICSSCSRNLIYRNCTKNPYFYCNSRYVNEKKECVKKVNAILLEQIVLVLLRLEIKKFANMNKIYKEYERFTSIRIRECEKEKQRLERELSRLQRQKQIQYEKYVQNGKKNINQKELSTIIKQIDKVKNQLVKIDAAYKTKKKSISLQNLYRIEDINKNKERVENTSIPIEFTKLTPRILDTFLKKICITNENYIQIEWSFCVNRFTSALL